jgi:small-conductance mechanosensitive channel
MENQPVENTIQFLKNIFEMVFTKFVVAIIILLIGFIIGKLLGKIIQRALHEIELNNLLQRATGIKISLEEIISSFITYFIYFITVIMALSQIGLTTTVLNMISAAIIVIIILSVFLGIKDFVPNMIAGIFIHQKRFINKGDRIKVKDIEGKIIHINLVETRIETKQKDIIYIPNSMLTKSEVTVIKKKK